MAGRVLELSEQLQQHITAAMNVTDLRDADSASGSQSEDRKELAAVLRTRGQTAATGGFDAPG